MTCEDLRKVSNLSREVLLESVQSSGDKEIDLSLLATTLKEVEKGFIQGPINKEELPVTLSEDQKESGDPTVLAKQQLKVMTSLHNICVNQFFAHETFLKAQMVATRVQETFIPIFFYFGWVLSNMKCNDWQIIWKRTWIWELRHWTTFKYPFRASETSLGI